MRRCRWCAPRRCRSTCSLGTFASNRSRWSPPAKAPTSSSGATSCSRRSCSASSTVREPERAVELLDQLYAYLGPAAARRGPAWRRFLLETGADDEQLGSHLTRAHATAAVKAFYRQEVAAGIGDGRARPPSGGPAGGLRALEPARAGRLARADDAARALPALGAGRPGGDGARGRGPLPLPRPSGLRALGATAPSGEAGRHAREGRAARGRREGAAGGDRRAGQAAVPGTRDRALLHPGRARVGCGRAVAGGAGGDRDLGRAARRRPAPPLPGRSRDRRARVDGARRHPLDAALASRVRRSRGRRLPTGEPASRGSESIAPAEPRAEEAA